MAVVEHNYVAQRRVVDRRLGRLAVRPRHTTDAAAILLDDADPVRVALADMDRVVPHLRETQCLLEFSLCLSRDCLGKPMIFIYINGAKEAFLYR